MIEEFRPAILGDVEAVVTLVNGAYRPAFVQAQAGWTHESSLIAGERTNPAQINNLLVQPNSTVLLGFLAGTLVACIHVDVCADAAYLGMLAVDPRLQDQGLGKQILAYAEGYVSQLKSVQRLLMSVLAERKELIAFYQRRGYRLTGQQTEYPTKAGVGVPLVAGIQLETLEKSLLSHEHR